MQKKFKKTLKARDKRNKLKRVMTRKLVFLSH